MNDNEDSYDISDSSINDSNVSGTNTTEYHSREMHDSNTSSVEVEDTYPNISNVSSVAMPDEINDSTNITDNIINASNVSENTSPVAVKDVSNASSVFTTDEIDDTFSSPVAVKKKHRNVLASDSEEDENTTDKFVAKSFTTPRANRRVISDSEEESDGEETDNKEESFGNKQLNSARFSLKANQATTSENHSNNESNDDDSEDELNNVFETSMAHNLLKESNNSILEISSSDEEENDDLNPRKSPTIANFPQNAMTNFVKVESSKSPSLDKLDSSKSPEISNLVDVKSAKQLVSEKDYNLQKYKLNGVVENVKRLENTFKFLNSTGKLGDGGKALQSSIAVHQQQLIKERQLLMNMEVQTAPPKPITWEELQKGAGVVQPRTFGKQAVQTYDNQKSLTLDGLKQLHGSLETCPGTEVLANKPDALKSTVTLMPHQRHAIAWLLWRENEKPSGGLLADDMGLGKTLTMLSVILSTVKATRELQSQYKAKKGFKTGEVRLGGTLIVCPASLLGQWTGEVKKHVKRNELDVLEYHGNNRSRDAKHLPKVDMVVTTYAIVTREYANNTDLFNIKWRRVILDEAHIIRNHKTNGSVAACALKAQSRWALSGTPVHNKDQDMYGLLKFLRCSPFDDFMVWKRWIANKATGGEQRLHTVIKSIMLRRTKAELIAAKMLHEMPERNSELVEIKMDRDELTVYNKIMVFSRTLFSQFLHQRAQKDTERNFINNPLSKQANAEYDKMHRLVMKLNQQTSGGEVQQSQILVLLLRLRQMCCHPSLVTSMMEGEGLQDVDGTEIGGTDMLDILKQLDSLKMESEETAESNEVAQPFIEAAKAVFNKDHPVFKEERVSSKISKCIEVLKTKVLITDDKAIVVSQWTTLLYLTAVQLKKENIKFLQLDGRIKVASRAGIVDDFNNPRNPSKVLLLSLTAGGVGLNLVGANHLLLLDLHWNPQLESQAQDRIYRIGQTKPVHIYKLITVDTIEQRILALQEHKLKVAAAMLTGSAIQQNKLSLNDLCMLFNM